jgi:hypothetical protein
MSRRKNTYFSDCEESYLKPDEETAAERTEEKLINAVPRLASTRSYADKPNLKFRHFGN